ncbi:MAG: substrate-binding domain-containing protein [Ectothiorhodospiraceae bacterium]|nr:substrate-binding domain-containing protein [Ectothiorhodospiraceae bacterium]
MSTNAKQRSRFVNIKLLPFLLSSFLVCTFGLTNTSLAATNTDDDALMGAGAHFAWILFDAIKADLEAKTGRKTILFGENSMLGVGCNAGIKAAKQGTKSRETFGFVCCPLSDEEIEKEQLIVYPLAKEPILILAHQDNPVNDLSSEQVRAIFRGDLDNWSQVKGPNKPIVVVTRLHCKKRPGHWKSILPSHKSFRAERLNVKSAAAMVERVSDFKGAIGHTGSTWAFGDNDKIKVITIDGAKPTAANLANGKYRFFRQLSAITNRTPSEDVVKLIHETQNGVAFRKVAKKYELLPFSPQ